MKNSYRQARENSGLKAQIAATKLGISVSTLSNWERGETSPNAVYVVRMAKLYGVSADELIASEWNREEVLKA